MKEKNSIKFNFNKNMAKYLIEFNELKKRINNIKNNSELSDIDFYELQKLERKLKSLRINFIIEFRKNNRDSIEQYLNAKKLKKDV